MAKTKQPVGHVPARFAPLFKPGRFGSLELKNRLVMPPMVRNYADANGLVTDRYVAHIERIARGGVGAMILEASYVRPDGKGFANELGAHDDSVVPGWQKLATVAHRHGAKIGIQLYHAGRQASSKVSGLPNVGPSPLPEPTVLEKPHALTIKEIKDVVVAFGDAAERAKRAGLDFIELHGAHGYLICQFLSPFSNQRTDAYGGTPEKRLRFLLEVYAEMRRRVGPTYPIILRLSGDEFVKGGLTIKDAIAIAQRLEKEGVAAIHVSAGNYASYAQGLMIPPMAIGEAPLLPLAAKMRKAVSIPVIAVAKLRKPEVAAEALKDGAADFIAIGRSLLADPEWPLKVQEGRLKDIRPCISCNQGCISRLFAQQDVWCTVNPENGRERQFAVPAKVKRVVWVVGGGPAGLVSAILAAERGHEVTLFEKSRKLGGQLTAAAAAPYRGDWADYRDWLIHRVKSLPVTLHLGHEFKPADAMRERPDALIMAIGSAVTLPRIPGADLPHVLTARDLLTTGKKIQGRVVLAGGGCMGAQTAEYLVDCGHHVTLVEVTADVAMEAPSDERNLLLQRLAKKKVKLMTGTRVERIEKKGVIVKTGQKQIRLPADSVVLCLGAVANDAMVGDIEGIIKMVIIGDAVEPRRVTEAVAEAAQAVLNL